MLTIKNYLYIITLLLTLSTPSLGQATETKEKKPLPDFSNIFPDIKLLDKGPMTNGMRYAYITDFESEEVIKKLKASLNKDWIFREVVGEEFKSTSKQIKEFNAELISFYYLSHPDHPNSEIVVNLTITQNKLAKKYMLSILTNTTAKVTFNKKVPIEAKQHVEAIFYSNAEQLKATYAEKIKIMPGHEALKPEHNIEQAKKGGRKTAITVPAKILIDFSLAQAKVLPPKAQVKRLLESLTYKNMEIKTGDFTTDPADPIGTPDGKLHFDIIESDRLIKILAPNNKDFLLLQMRKSQGKWKVIAEYMD